ncbi:MAG: hypothetical protein MK078_17640 [Crocinitomicaceae bacterium]|nr:hypothetical protein [Crocinitomicaceae bacterium]
MFKTFFILVTTMCISNTLISQNLTAFSDVNNRLYKFDNGVFSQIYYLEVKELHIGNTYIAYVDNKGDIIVNYNGEDNMIAQTHTSITPSDNLLLVQTATVLRVFDKGKPHILTSSAKSYAMNDSLVLWHDQIGNYLKYYYNNEVHELMMVVGDYQVDQQKVGANTFVFVDNIGTYQGFWRGQFYELFSSNFPSACVAGQDIIAFNDPNTRTFAVFDAGELLDVEDQQVSNIRVGNGFAYYLDASGTHKVYHKGEIQELSFADITNVNVRDSMIFFNDIGIHKVWYNDQVYQIFNNRVEDYQIDGGIIAYRNNMGGVSALVRGKELLIEESRVESYRLNGNCILLQYGPSSFGVWWRGKVYRF